MAEQAAGPRHLAARSWADGWGPQALWFGVYVLWLTAFPMAGVLLSPGARLSWFALPHALALLALGRWMAPQTLHRLLPLSTLATALGTVLYAFGGLEASAGGAVAALLALLGLVAAPLSVQVGVSLGGARWPVAAAALGLCLGNMGSVLLEHVPASDVGKLSVLACLLPGVLRLRASPPQALSESAPMPLWRFLPFVALFQVVSGLMYGQLWPGVRAQIVWPGVELLAYVAGVLAAARFVGRHALRCVLAAVGLAVASFTAHHAASGWAGQHLSLFSMLAAAGIVDLVLLSEILARDNRIRAYGYAVGVMVLGIALGEALARGLQGRTALSVALLALVLLNLATVALFLQRHVPRRDAVMPVPTTETIARGEGPPLPALPARIAHRLSEQEQRVLQAVLQDQPYRVIAQGIGVSESSVKTYMQRIYRKLGVYRRGQLADLMTDSREGTEQAPSFRTRSGSSSDGPVNP